MNLDFLKTIISNESGSGSSNRVCLVLVVLALIGWSSVSVYQTGTIPDISSSWVGLIGIFVGGVGLTKATDAVREIKAPEPEEPQA